MRVRCSEENVAMRILYRSAPLLLVLGVALAGCDLGQDPKWRGLADADAIPSTFRDTQANQVVLQVHGLR